MAMKCIFQIVLLIVFGCFLDLNNGWIKDCPGSENNKTVQGQLHGSVNMTFCVRSEPMLFYSMQMSGNGCRNVVWCLHNDNKPGMSITTILNRFQNYLVYHISVLIYRISENEFYKPFNITLYTETTGESPWLNVSDTFTLSYRIEKAERTAAFSRITTNRATTSFTNATNDMIRTHLTTSATTSTLRPECPKVEDRKCPRGWVHVGELCLSKSPVYGHVASMPHRCQQAAVLEERDLTDSVRSCLLELLKGASKNIVLQNGIVLNVQTSIKDSDSSGFVVCKLNKDILRKRNTGAENTTEKLGLIVGLGVFTVITTVLAVLLFRRRYCGRSQHISGEYSFPNKAQSTSGNDLNPQYSTLSECKNIGPATLNSISNTYVGNIDFIDPTKSMVDYIVPKEEILIYEEI